VVVSEQRQPRRRRRRASRRHLQLLVLLPTQPKHRCLPHPVLRCRRHHHRAQAARAYSWYASATSSAMSVLVTR